MEWFDKKEKKKKDIIKEFVKLLNIRMGLK